MIKDMKTICFRKEDILRNLLDTLCGYIKHYLV